MDRIEPLLRDLGASGLPETREKIRAIPDAREQVYALPENLAAAKPTQGELELVIRGVCRMEGWQGEADFSFGSTTVIPRLLKLFSTGAEKDALVDWLFANRVNPYIPLGAYVPLAITSHAEYREEEKRREAHREGQLAKDKETSRLAQERRKESARLHAERSAKNRAARGYPPKA